MNEKQKNLVLYIGLLLGVVVGCLPNGPAQGISAILVTGALVFGYVLRAQEKNDTIVAHHATFVIRTIWIWSVFLLVGMFGAGIMVQMSGDMRAIDELLGRIYSGAFPTIDDIRATTESYMADNYDLMLRMTIVWLAPAQVYAVWRVVKGLSRALGGYRVKNVMGWL